MSKRSDSTQKLKNKLEDCLRANASQKDYIQEMEKYATQVEEYVEQAANVLAQVDSEQAKYLVNQKPSKKKRELVQPLVNIASTIKNEPKKSRHGDYSVSQAAGMDTDAASIGILSTGTGFGSTGSATVWEAEGKLVGFGTILQGSKTYWISGNKIVKTKHKAVIEGETLPRGVISLIIGYRGDNDNDIDSILALREIRYSNQLFFYQKLFANSNESVGDNNYIVQRSWGTKTPELEMPEETNIKSWQLREVAQFKDSQPRTFIEDVVSEEVQALEVLFQTDLTYHKINQIFPNLALEKIVKEENDKGQNLYGQFVTDTNMFDAMEAEPQGGEQDSLSGYASQPGQPGEPEEQHLPVIQAMEQQIAEQQSQTQAQSKGKTKKTKSPTTVEMPTPAYAFREDGKPLSPSDVSEITVAIPTKPSAAFPTKPSLREQNQQKRAECYQFLRQYPQTVKALHRQVMFDEKEAAKTKSRKS
jgi:hypothetical protein